MKRLVALVLASIMLFSVAVAYADDYSSLSDEQLIEQLNAIRNELVSRGFKAEKNRVLLEKNGIQVYINGDPVIKRGQWSDTEYLYIPIVIINNTDKVIMCTIDNTSENGWKVYGFISEEVPAGKKSKSQIEFNLDDDVKTIDDLEEIEFTFRVFDSNNWSAPDIVPTTSPVTITF